MKAEIVMIGSELLLGQIVDTNATYLAQQLNAIGISLFYKTTVGDNAGRMEEVLNQALSRSDLVITSGGLGPTDDDLTREVVAQATGQELEFQPALLEHIEALFQRVKMKMSPSNRRQAYVPRGAIVIPNPRGTAPGFIVEEPRGVLVSLPGVPSELKALMEASVIPYLRQKFGLGQSLIQSRVLRVCGITEAGLGEEITDLMRQSVNPTVGVLAKQGEIEVRVTARAQDEPEARVLLGGMEEEIRRRLGRLIFGIDEETMEGVVSGLLREAGLTLSLVETCTGGLIAQRLTSVAPEVLKEGRVAIHDEARRRVLHLSEEEYHRLAQDGTQLARALARGIRDFSGSDLGLAVLGQLPQSGEEKGEIEHGQAYFALAMARETSDFQFGFRGWSREGQTRTSTLALDMVRRHLQEKEMAQSSKYPL